MYVICAYKLSSMHCNMNWKLTKLNVVRSMLHSRFVLAAATGMAAVSHTRSSTTSARRARCTTDTSTSCVSSTARCACTVAAVAATRATTACATCSPPSDASSTTAPSKSSSSQCEKYVCEWLVNDDMIVCRTPCTLMLGFFSQVFSV